MECNSILIEYKNCGRNLDALFGGSNTTNGLVGIVSSELEGLKEKLLISTGEVQQDT